MSTVKKENAIILNNKYRDWFKMSQAQNIEKKPYYLVRVVMDQEQAIDALRDVTIDAYSANQARHFFLERYPWLKESFSVFGSEVEFVAKLDKRQWEQRQIENIRLRKVKETKKQDREETIQEAWWND